MCYLASSTKCIMMLCTYFEWRHSTSNQRLVSISSRSAETICERISAQKSLMMILAPLQGCVTSIACTATNTFFWINIVRCQSRYQVGVLAVSIPVISHARCLALRKAGSIQEFTAFLHANFATTRMFWQDFCFGFITCVDRPLRHQV